MRLQHKSLQQQTELLNSLRAQIRSMDSEILSEEAGYVIIHMFSSSYLHEVAVLSLSDFKRTSSKNWMVLKFGGLLELAEKATVWTRVFLLNVC